MYLCIYTTKYIQVGEIVALKQNNLDHHDFPPKVSKMCVDIINCCDGDIGYHGIMEFERIEITHIFLKRSEYQLCGSRLSTVYITLSNHYIQWLHILSVQIDFYQNVYTFLK